MSKTLYYICIIALIIFIIYSYYKYSKYWKKILYEPILDPISAKNPLKILDPKNNTLVPNPKHVESLKSSKFIHNSNEPSNLGLAYSLSFWIYIEDWNYKYDRDKKIISWNPNLLVTLGRLSFRSPLDCLASIIDILFSIYTPLSSYVVLPSKPLV